MSKYSQLYTIWGSWPPNDVMTFDVHKVVFTVVIRDT